MGRAATYLTWFWKGWRKSSILIACAVDWYDLNVVLFFVIIVYISHDDGWWGCTVTRFRCKITSKERARIMLKWTTDIRRRIYTAGRINIICAPIIVSRTLDSFLCSVSTHFSYVTNKLKEFMIHRVFSFGLNRTWVHSVNEMHEGWYVFHFDIHTHARFNPIVNADNAREILPAFYSCTSFLLDQTISHIHFTVVWLFIILFSEVK